MAIDDRFRHSGGRYENDEPVAIAVVRTDEPVDWSSEQRSPVSTLWIPESLFLELSAGTRLGSVNVYEQTRLGPAECAVVDRELTAVEATSARSEVREAAALVRDRVRRVLAAGHGHALLVEGP